MRGVAVAARLTFRSTERGEEEERNRNAIVRCGDRKSNGSMPHLFLIIVLLQLYFLYLSRRTTRSLLLLLID